MIMTNPPHLVVAVDEVDHVGDDGVARVLGRLAHHPKVQVAQITRARRQQVAWAHQHAHWPLSCYCQQIAHLQNAFAKI